MPPVSGVVNPPPVQPPGGGHGDHDANAAPNASTGQSFSAALAQAINQAPGAEAHGSHGSASGGVTESFSANSAPRSGGHATSAGILSEGSNLRHFPIGGVGHDEGHGFQETALGLRAYRQQLIASNIANGDTPGYKAVDIDFQEALRIARSVANIRPLVLSTTASGHITAQPQSFVPPYPLKYHTPSQPSADGNTVEMDVERSKFAENAVMYEFSLNRVSGHFKMIEEMLRNLKD